MSENSGESKEDVRRSDGISRFCGPIISLFTFLFIGFLLLVIWSANTKTNSGLLKFGVAFPHSDKLAHFLLIGMATFLLNVSLRNRTTFRFSRNWLLGSLVIFVIMTLEEFSQIFIPGRSFDWLDLIANYLGILVFGLLAKCFIKSPSR